MAHAYRAVVFDAVGTLIHADPAVPLIYATIGRRHGSRLDDATVATRFKSAFRRQDDIDRAANWITSEPRERERWRAIVSEVLDDADFEPTFADLYAHFAQPDAWRVDPAAERVLASLRGFQLAMASNFDERLHGIVAGLPALRGLQKIIVSSQVGVRKPGRAFFAAIEKRLEMPAAEIVFVGDDPINDGEGATAAGMRSLLVGDGFHSIEDVTQFLKPV